MTGGPIVARRLLGIELRQLRTAAGVDGLTAAGAIHASPSKISRIESGKTLVSRTDVAVLLALYGITREAAREDLLSLADQSRQPDWWSPLAEDLNVSDRHHLGLESEASLILAYEPQAIPVMLQTPRYARALVDHDPASLRWRGGLSAGALARRRGILYSPDPPRLWILIQYAALTRNPARDPQVLVDQLESLRGLLCNPSVRHRIVVWIVPDSAAAAVDAPGPFEVLRFSPGEIPPVVLREEMTFISSDERQSEVDKHTELFNRLAMQALAPAECVDALAGLLDRSRPPEAARKG